MLGEEAIPENGMLEWVKLHGASQGWKTSFIYNYEWPRAVDLKVEGNLLILQGQTHLLCTVAAGGQQVAVWAWNRTEGCIFRMALHFWGT